MTEIPPRLLRDTAAAIRERFVATEFQTTRLPDELAETVLNAVPGGWTKTYPGNDAPAGEWSHRFENPMTKREGRHLGEWMDWEDRFPFVPRRRWARAATKTAQGYTSFSPPKILMHNRFLRIRVKDRLLFDEFLGLDLRFPKKKWPTLRGNIGRVEFSLTVIPKKEWRAG